MKKIAVLTSGGDAPGMNAAIRSVVRTSIFHKINCVGIYGGYDGIIAGDFIPMKSRNVSNIINKGGTILKSARSEEFRTKKGRLKAYKNLKKEGVEGLVLLGGDGTFTGGMVFRKEYNFPVIGVPCTIDNDIYGTEYTIGYDTAINTVVGAIDKIRDTATSHNRLFFIEVMGRDAGFIALNTGIGSGAEEILIPEKKKGIKGMMESLDASKKIGKSSGIVVVAEGEKSGKNIFELAAYVEEKRPEYDVKVSVLGHMQRGGAPTCFDRVLATRLGVKAVESLLEKKSNLMVGIKNKKVCTVDLESAVKETHEINEELLRVFDIMKV